ncbi:MAG: TIGR03936 family radical SAM-associated protein [Atribacterota bacterium]|nr:TIGR03936 family radical SAM-associated protein [Atribacterota bacterium]
MRYNYRIEYKKNGPLKYISHLDLSALFCRALRRARIPVELTQGFNSRFRVSFGPALSLGFTGWKELLDVSLTEELENNLFKEKINHAAPVGLEITHICQIDENALSLSRYLQFASYLMQIEFQSLENDIKREEKIAIVKHRITEFKHRQNIFIKKQTKKQLKEIDLKPLIYQMELVSDQMDNICHIRLIIDIEQRGSINPLLIIKEFLVKNDDLKISISNVIREKFIFSSN